MNLDTCAQDAHKVAVIMDVTRHKQNIHKQIMHRSHLASNGEILTEKDLNNYRRHTHDMHTHTTTTLFHSELQLLSMSVQNQSKGFWSLCVIEKDFDASFLNMHYNSSFSINR